MAIRKVNWFRSTSKGRSFNRDVPHSCEILQSWECVSFFEKGDDFLVFHNEDNDQYAVYWKLYNGGELRCLNQHFDNLQALRDTDDGFMDEVYEVFRKKAMDAGFPRTWHEIPRGLTWRELIKQLEEYPELLDEVAYVWTPTDPFVYDDDFTTIDGIEPYDGDETASAENFLSITLNVK